MVFVKAKIMLLFLCRSNPLSTKLGFCVWFLYLMIKSTRLCPVSTVATGLPMCFGCVPIVAYAFALCWFDLSVLPDGTIGPECCYQSHQLHLLLRIPWQDRVDSLSSLEGLPWCSQACHLALKILPQCTCNLAVHALQSRVDLNYNKTCCQHILDMCISLSMTVCIASEMQFNALQNCIPNLMQHLYVPGILPSSVSQYVLGNVYLRSKLSRKHVYLLPFSRNDMRNNDCSIDAAYSINIKIWFGPFLTGQQLQKGSLSWRTHTLG